jgi:hypothetical protein
LNVDKINSQGELSISIIGVLFLISFLLLFGGILYFAIQSTRKEAEQKKQMAQSLGFSPVETDPKLEEKIARLYRRSGAQTRYELRNVSRRTIPDGEMYLFDLVDKSGDDDSWTERQAVAIVSSYLKLPPFTLFPKTDQKYALSGLANKVLEWGMTFVGSPIPFPEYPDFNARYVVTSNESSDWVRGFFDQRVVDYFSRTQMFMLHGMDDIFTFVEMDPKFKPADPESMSHRVNQALDVLRVLQK